VQHVPRTIYDASYPCWALSRPRVLAMLRETGWRMQAEFTCREGTFSLSSGLEITFRGLIAERDRERA
jgi:hypothetical protein